MPDNSDFLDLEPFEGDVLEPEVGMGKVFDEMLRCTIEHNDRVNKSREAEPEAEQLIP